MRPPTRGFQRPLLACFAATVFAATPSGAPAATWTPIAAEGQGFSVASNTPVRYGSGSSWVYATLSGPVQCSNNFFGDPIVGTVKECDIEVATPPTVTWTPIASEGQSFSVAGNTAVRYGSGSTWIYATVSGQVQCSNGFFGTDPLVGTVKECDVQPAATTPAAIATLAWAAPAGAVAGYRVYSGTASGRYAQSPGNGTYVTATTATVSNLQPATTYYFAVTAVGSSGIESGYSAEATKRIP